MMVLLITAVVTIVISPVFISVRMLTERDRDFYQDETGIYQLQLLLAVNDITEIDSDVICFSTIENDCRLHIVNGKLISQPGTVDYIHGINAVEFYVEDTVVYMNYERKGHLISMPIGYFNE